MGRASYSTGSRSHRRELRQQHGREPPTDLSQLSRPDADLSIPQQRQRTNPPAHQERTIRTRLEVLTIMETMRPEPPPSHPSHLGVAQLVEYSPRKGEVAGSSPATQTMKTQHDRRAADEMAAPADRGVVQRQGHFPVTEEDAGSNPVATAMKDERFTTASAPAEAPATPGAVAQSVEQRTENPRVDGSIPSRTTIRDPFFAYVMNMTRPSFARLCLPRPQLTQPSAGLCSR